MKILCLDRLAQVAAAVGSHAPLPTSAGAAGASNGLALSQTPTTSTSSSPLLSSGWVVLEAKGKPAS